MNPLLVYIYYESSPSEIHASSSESHCLIAAEFADSDLSVGDSCCFDLRLRVTFGVDSSHRNEIEKVTQKLIWTDLEQNLNWTSRAKIKWIRQVAKELNWVQGCWKFGPGGLRKFWNWGSRKLGWHRTFETQSLSLIGCVVGWLVDWMSR